MVCERELPQLELRHLVGHAKPRLQRRGKVEDDTVPCRGKGETELMTRIGKKEWELFRGLGDAVAAANNTVRYQKMQEQQRKEGAMNAEAHALEALSDDMYRGSDGIWRPV